MKIASIRNFGKPSIITGQKSVTSQEVCPTTLTATASGLTFDINLLDNYNFFNAAQTSAATDLIILPATLPVGSEFLIQFASSAAIKNAASSGISINNGADTTAVTIAANATARVLKVSATRVIVHQYAAAGTISAPTPA